jgi:pimeloyl-ACP methyl ester carboxylesterase
MLKKYVIVLGLFLTSCSSRICDLEDIYASHGPQCSTELCAPQSPRTLGLKHSAVDTLTIEESFTNSYRSFLYVPSSPTPAKAPVILFLHGYFDAKPDRYDAMLRHYARSGYIVIYPTYGNALYPKSWAENAAEAYKRAIAYLDLHSAVKPDPTHLAYIGHSIGGLLAFHMAEKTLTQTPNLIVTSDAAGIATIAYPFLSIDELGHIPPKTKVLMMMAEETYLARFKEPDGCTEDGKAEVASPCTGFAANLRAMKRTSQIPTENKVALLIRSEKRGRFELRSDHNGAQGECGNEQKPINAIDTWGYWRYTRVALDAALKDEGGWAALKREETRRGGTWSDGQSAKTALLLDSCFLKGQCPTVTEVRN